MRNRQHWIDGAWTDGDGRGSFELSAARESGDALARFPRAGPADVARAISAARLAAAAWGEIHGEDRLARARRAWRAAAGELQDAARHVGLAEAELGPHRAGIRLPEDGEVAPLGAPYRGGTWLVRAHWSTLWDGPLHAADLILASGGAVVLCPDPRFPWPGEAWARALEQADLPRGAFALLHGLESSALADAARADPDLALWVVAPESELEWVRALPPRRAGGAPVETSLAAGRVLALPDEFDVERTAAEICAGAFGRARTLSGQLHGKIARVDCPERRFSALSAALLVELARSPDLADLVPPVDPASLPRAEALFARAQAEGAARIFGGERVAAGQAGSGARGRRLVPAVFTNVEPHMRLHGWTEPGPWLALCRVSGPPATDAPELGTGGPSATDPRPR